MGRNQQRRGATAKAAGATGCFAAAARGCVLRADERPGDQIAGAVEIGIQAGHRGQGNQAGLVRIQERVACRNAAGRQSRTQTPARRAAGPATDYRVAEGCSEAHADGMGTGAGVAQAKPVELPNILAIRLPEMARAFVPPPEIQPPQTAKIEVPDAPQLQAKPVDQIKLADTPKITRQFVAPPTQVPAQVTEVLAPSEAPQIEARLNAPADLNYSFKAPPRPFTAPPSKTAPPSSKQVAVDAPPALTANSRI